MTKIVLKVPLKFNQPTNHTLLFLFYIQTSVVLDCSDDFSNNVMFMLRMSFDVCTR